MALKLDITDDKGVKTRYHKIKSLEYDGEELKIRLVSYVNQAVRDAEKLAKETTKQAFEYDKRTEEIRKELDTLSSQLTPDGKGEPEVVARAVELSNEVNERVTNPDRPQYQEATEKSYNETEIKMEYFEPLTLEAIYDKLATGDKYANAEKI